MNRSLAAGHKIITDRPGKRQVGEVVAMEMSDFPFADTKFASAEAVRSRRHTRPVQELMFNGVTDFIGRCHGLSVCLIAWAGVRTFGRARTN